MRRYTIRLCFLAAIGGTILGLGGPPASFARTLYVAPGGSDLSPTPSDAKTPFRTIQKAATAAQPGDTVIVRAGTYRETVIPAHSGLPGAPITFKAAPGEVVTINGAELITGWKSASGKQYEAPMKADFYHSQHNYADQIFVDGQMMNLARWPNTSLDVSHPVKSTLTKFISKTRDKTTNYTTAVFEDDNLQPQTDGYYVGAQITIQPNKDAWSWELSGVITEQKGKRLTLRSRSDTGQDGNQSVYAVGSRYGISDEQKFLDSPGEWFHDKATGTLYLQTTTGDNPSQHRVEARARDLAFDLSDRSYLIIQGFHLFACTITTDPVAGDGVEWDEKGNDRYPWRNGGSLPGSHHIVLDGLDAKYVSHFTDVSGHFFLQWGLNTGINISGSQQTIQNCRIQYSAGNGISCYGRDNKVLNNIIEDTDYSAVDCAPINTTGGAGALDLEIANNTIRRCGRSGMSLRGLANSDVTKLVTRVHHNDIGDYMLQDFDGGATYTFGQDAKFVRVDHNWFHDASGPTVGGFYIDYSKNWIVDHNVIWNVEWAIHLEGAHTSGVVDALVFNNTALSRGQFVGIGNGQAPGSYYINNISNQDIGKAAAGAKEMKTNLRWDNRQGSETDPGFVDVKTNNYQLSANSPARGKGTAITVFSTQQPGNPDIIVTPPPDAIADGKPDLGAYKFGAPAWKAGSTLAEGLKAPAAPTNLKAIAAAATRVNLSWNDASDNETGFAIERKSGPGAWKEIAFAPTNATDYYDNGLKKGTSYSYRLRAINSAGASAFSPDAMVTTPLVSQVDAQIVHTNVAPALDGTLDAAWNAARGQPVATPVTGAFNGDANFSGSWKALWDAQSLYVLIEVTDDKVLGDPKTPWYSQDGAEIYLDADNSKKPTYDHINDFQLAFTASDGVLHFGQNSARDALNARYKVLRTATGYRAAIALPWTEILGYAPQPGALIGFDAMITDSDDGVTMKGKKSWRSKSNDAWMDPRLLGTVELVGAGPQ